MSSGSLKDLSLDGGVSRPGSSGGGGIRDVKKADMRDVRKIDRRVLRLCDSLIKVFYTVFLSIQLCFLPPPNLAILW